MSRKKVDKRIRILIENCVASHHRSLFIIVGEKGRNKVGVLHRLLTKASVRTRSSVLWCCKKKLGFNIKGKTKEKKQEKNGAERLDGDEDDLFKHFIRSTEIRRCRYRDTQQILGQTFGMLVLQDFEALTPNFLARTIETVEGGGIIVILLETITSLKQLYTMPMDVHDQYRTETHSNIVCRFNKRFVLSLASCMDCLVVNDELDILPVSSNAEKISPVQLENSEELKSPEQELAELKECFQDTYPIGVLINICQTLDQAKAFVKFVDVLAEKTNPPQRITVSLTSARGRGKSAALGLSLAAAIIFGYINIFVTAPSPENLKTLFSFLFEGFDALKYEDGKDYEIFQSENPEFKDAIVQVKAFKPYNHAIQYIAPTDVDKFHYANLVVIDEAAAIPLPHVKRLLGPYLIFMSSTVSGYEGTGRSLSLKLIDQLRPKNSCGASKDLPSESSGKPLHEVTLNESIRYKPGDRIEMWLNSLLCLDSSEVYSQVICERHPEHCQLFYINRDALFSYQKSCESLLQQVVGLLVESHYKNTPNDLLMLADAPGHHLFCLVAPLESNNQSPAVLCVAQICLEGRLSKETVDRTKSSGRYPPGDLIPWTLARKFDIKKDFPSLYGARIVRIATHPKFRKKGYGLQTLEYLREYYEGKFPTLEEIPARTLDSGSGGKACTSLTEETSSLPLLMKLTQRRPEALDYIGVSYGLTAELLRFWKKAKFIPVYVSVTENDVTGEHTCIMLKTLENGLCSEDWLSKLFGHFKFSLFFLVNRMLPRSPASLALSLFTNGSVQEAACKVYTKKQLHVRVCPRHIHQLELFNQNMRHFSTIGPIIPGLARLHFLGGLGKGKLTSTQTAILMGVGAQCKSIEEIAVELDSPVQQIMGLFSGLIRGLTRSICEIIEKEEAKTLFSPKDVNMDPIDKSLQQELEEAEKDIKAKQKMAAKKLQEDLDLSEYAIAGSEEDWKKALKGSEKTLVSIKRIQKSGSSSEDQLSYKRKAKGQGKTFNFKKRKM